jgi:hypothetical protein
MIVIPFENILIASLMQSEGGRGRPRSDITYGKNPIHPGTLPLLFSLLILPFPYPLTWRGLRDILRRLYLKLCKAHFPPHPFKLITHLPQHHVILTTPNFLAV